MPAKTPRSAGVQAPDGGEWITDVLAANVRAYRQLRRTEQEDIAERMNTLGHAWRRVTVSEVERGKRNVTVPELMGLVLVLGASIQQLLDPRGPEERSGPNIAVNDDIALQAWQMRALVCSTKTLYFDAKWRDNDLQGIDVTESREIRPDLQDVDPAEGVKP
jgi:transcriptional regulator with XRE-family HTH domain